MKARVKCLVCHTTLHSRRPRDFQKCNCENETFVDLMFGKRWRVGGIDVTKVLVLDHNQTQERDILNSNNVKSLRAATNEECEALDKLKGL